MDVLADLPVNGVSTNGKRWTARTRVLRRADLTEQQASDGDQLLLVYSLSVDAGPERYITAFPATALRLSEEMATVVLVARRVDRLKAIAEKIESSGGRALSIECDVADREQAADAVAQTVQQFGRLDTLVNNAGVMLLVPIENAKPKRLRTHDRSQH